MCDSWPTSASSNAGRKQSNSDATAPGQAANQYRVYGRRPGYAAPVYFGVIDPVGANSTMV